MIGDLFFFQETPDAEVLAHFGEGVEVDFVGGDLGGFVEAAGDGEFEVGGDDAGLGGEVEVDFISLQRVVVAFAKLQLPGGDAALIIEEVFEDAVIEVEEGSRTE